MKIRTLLSTTAVVVTAAAAAFTTQAAQAAQPAQTAAAHTVVPFRGLPGLRIPTVNLHAKFEAALARVSTAKPAGVIPMIGHAQAGKTAPASTTTPGTTSACTTEPNCDLTYHGGPVQHSPHVILVFWGPDWATDETENGAEEYLALFFYGLGLTNFDDWSTISSQYGDPTGHPVFGTSVMGGINFWVDSSLPPATVTPDDLAAEAESIAAKANVTDFTDTQVIVASQSGTCFSDGFGGNCGQQQDTGYCGWHSYTTDSEHLPYVNLPYSDDAGLGCGEDFVNPETGIYDGFSMTGGHEYMETVTDPLVTGWYDANDSMDGGGEIGDKCIYGGQEWGSNDPFGNLILPTPAALGPVQYFPFAVQSLWSNATASCVMAGKLPFTVTPVGNQKITLGKAFSRYIIASTGYSVPLTYKATGLPPGITLSATGHIAGTPAVTAGTFKSAFTISYYDGSTSFPAIWQVSSLPGPVKGYAARCADDYAGHTANGTKIDIWKCVGGTRQKITFAANGELLVAGKCVTGGTTAVLEPCKATANQVWTRLANGEYVLKSSGKCLTDPGNSTANGKQLTLTVCKNAAAQRWSLP